MNSRRKLALFLLLSLLSISLKISYLLAKGDYLFFISVGGPEEEFVSSVIETSTKEFVFIGSTESYGVGKKDVFLFKIDNSGKLLWYKTYGGDENDVGYAVVETSDDGFLITGSVSTSTEFPSSIGDDIFIIKVNNNGELIWHKEIGHNAWDRGQSIIKTSDGNYLIGGVTQDYAFYPFNIYLIKIDSQGNVIWSQIIKNEGDNQVYSLIESDNGFLVVGSTKSYNMKEDVFILKINSFGKMMWFKTYGGKDNDGGCSIVDSGDGYLITGYTNSFGAGKYDVYIIKTDKNGDKLWNKTIGGIKDDFGRSIQKTRDGSYIIAGDTISFGKGSSDIFFMKINSYGDIESNETFGTSNYDVGGCVIETSDGNFILTGSIGIHGTDIGIYKIRLSRCVLNLVSSHGTVFGENKYYEGSLARFGVYHEIIDVSEGVRYVFDGWISQSPGGYNGNENPAEVRIYNDIIQTAKWKKQYFVEVKSDSGGQVNPPSGWYDEGTNITFSALPHEDNRLLRWVGQGSSSYSGSLDEFSITLVGPISEMAFFKAISTYTLSIQSDYGDLIGEGTYPEDTLLSFSVSPTIIHETENIQYVFYRWTSLSPGGYIGPENPASVILKNDIIEVAEWKTQFFVDIRMGEGGKESFPSGWYDAGSNITISVIPEERYRFSSWNGSGVGSYSGPSQEFSINLKGPITQIAYFELKPTYKLNVQSRYGSTTGTQEYFEGTKVSFSVSPNIINESEGVRYVFDGWTSNSPDGYYGNENSAEIIINDDIVQTAKWKKQYYINLYSPVDLGISGWYDENYELNLNLIYKGFLIRKILRYRLNNYNREYNELKLIISKSMIIIAEWRLDFLQVYALMGVMSFSSLILLYRRHQSILAEYAKKQKHILDALNLKGKILFNKLSNELNYSTDYLIEVIKKSIQDGKILGILTYDNEGFITLNELRNITNMNDYTLEEILKNICDISLSKISYIKLDGIKPFTQLYKINNFTIRAYSNTMKISLSKIKPFLNQYNINNINANLLNTYKKINIESKKFNISKKILELTPSRILKFDTSLSEDEIISLVPNLFPEELLEKYKIVDGAIIPTKSKVSGILQSEFKLEEEYEIKDSDKEQTTYERLYPCPKCSGTGQIEMVIYYREDGQVKPVKHFVTCPQCDGHKFVYIRNNKK